MMKWLIQNSTNKVLNEYESRMNLLNNLKRKYGKSISGINLISRKKLNNEINKIENYEQVHRSYEKK